MYEHFGAVVDGQQVEFKLFFPDNARDPAQYVRGGLPGIREIRVRGDLQSRIGGQDWELASAPLRTKTAHPKGWLFTCALRQALPEGFSGTCASIGQASASTSSATQPWLFL